MAEKEKKKTEDTAQKFELKELHRHSEQLFGVAGFVFEGATYGLTGEYTVEEMRTIIEEWLKTEAI